MSDEPIKGTIYPNNAFFKGDSKPEHHLLNP